MYSKEIPEPLQMNEYTATAAVAIKDCSKFQIGKGCAQERYSHLRNLREVACHLNIKLVAITTAIDR